MTRKKRTTEQTDWKALIGEDANLLKAIVQQALQEVLKAERSEGPKNKREQTANEIGARGEKPAETHGTR